MKQLTNQELLVIDKALTEICSFKNFEDVKLEVLDHIALEIEAEMHQNATDFKTAFIKIMTQWNPLILSRNWSRYENVPYIVCKLWKSLDLKYQYSIIPIAALITLFLSKLTVSNTLYIILPFVLIGTITNTFLIYKKLKNKHKTTLSSYALHKIEILTAMNIFVYFITLNFAKDTTSIILPLLWLLVYSTFATCSKALIMHKNVKIENQLLKLA